MSENKGPSKRMYHVLGATAVTQMREKIGEILAENDATAIEVYRKEYVNSDKYPEHSFELFRYDIWEWTRIAFDNFNGVCFAESWRRSCVY